MSDTLNDIKDNYLRTRLVYLEEQLAQRDTEIERLTRYLERIANSESYATLGGGAGYMDGYYHGINTNVKAAKEALARKELFNDNPTIPRN